MRRIFRYYNNKLVQIRIITSDNQVVDNDFASLTIISCAVFNAHSKVGYRHFLQGDSYTCKAWSRTMQPAVIIFRHSFKSSRFHCSPLLVQNYEYLFTFFACKFQLIINFSPSFFPFILAFVSFIACPAMFFYTKT